MKLEKNKKNVFFFEEKKSIVEFLFELYVV